MAEAAPRRRSWRVWFISIGVALLVLGALAVHFVPLLSPLGTAQRFCQDLQQQQYADLYTRLFASAVRSQVDATIFVAAEQLADEQTGKVQQCSASPLHAALQTNGATVVVTETRPHGLVVDVTLHLQAGSWSITNLPDAAVLPFTTAYAFCSAIATQQYQAAYNLLSPAITTSLPLDRFLTFEQLADQNNGVVDSCTIAHLSLGGAQATAMAKLVRKGGDPAGAQVVIMLGQQADGRWSVQMLPPL